VSSPNMEKLAAQGLRYNRFHTTALCSPTRAALITGRDHHMSGNGGITEAATGYDGYVGIIPERAPALSPKSCGRTATPLPGSARTTTHPFGRRARLAHSTAGPMVSASIISTASTPATRVNTSRSFTGTATASPVQATPTTTSRQTSPTTRFPGCRR
jgi:hypothetical protein